MIQVGLSFDDGLVDQLKWAHTLQVVGLRAIFYVSPGLLGSGINAKRQVYATELHVARIAEMGHVVGNHTWKHEALATHAIGDCIEAADRARVWLEKRGYNGTLLALPYGSRGGAWDEAAVAALHHLGYATRDVRFAAEDASLGALESCELSLSAPLDLRYFHGNHNTDDDDLARFFYWLAAEQAAGRVQVVLPATGVAPAAPQEPGKCTFPLAGAPLSAALPLQGA